MTTPVAGTDEVPIDLDPGQRVNQRRGVLAWLRGNLQLIVGLLISAWSIRELLEKVDVATVGQHLANANWVLLAICFLSVPFSMVLKTIRWQCLFPQSTAPPVPPLLSALYIGYLMNTVLPARVGELARAFLAGREHRQGTPAALATIVVEKVLDLGTLVVILFALIYLNRLPALPDWMASSRYTSGVALLLGIAGMVALVVMRQRVMALVDLIEQRAPLLQRLRPTALASSFLDGLAALGHPKTLPGVVFWSVAVWVSATFTMWVGLAGMGLWVGLPAVLLALVVTNLGMAVPSAPGYVGVYHGLLVLALLPFGIDEEQALGAAIIMHLLIFGNFIFGGTIFLFRGGHSLGGLRNASHR